MAISSLTQLLVGQSTNLFRSSDRVRATIEKIALGADLGLNNQPAASTDVSPAQVLQSQISGLRSAGLKIAEASSTLQAADAGLEKADSLLRRLSELAKQMQDVSLTTEQRQLAQQQINSDLQSLNTLASNTTFRNAPLLNGNRIALFNSGEASESQVQLGDIRTSQLFSQPLSVATVSEAEAAESAINTARNVIETQRDYINGLREGFDAIANTFEVAVQNNEAALSNLPEVGLSSGNGGLSIAALLGGSSNALQAQGNRLQPSILSLLQS
jgi:flagellin